MNELEIVQHRQIEGLSIFLNTIDYRTPHIHPEWELIWVLDQPLSVACGKSSFTAQVGQMVLFSPNEPHEFHKIGENATFACLQIAPGILTVDRRLIADGKLPHEYLPEEDFKRLWLPPRKGESQYLRLTRQRTGSLWIWSPLRWSWLFRSKSDLFIKRR